MTTIDIGTYAVPKPETEPPEIGTVYYMPHITGFLGRELYITATWRNCQLGKGQLRSGVVHLTKEAATLHAMGIISLTGDFIGDPADINNMYHKGVYATHLPQTI